VILRGDRNEPITGPSGERSQIRHGPWSTDFLVAWPNRRRNQSSLLRHAGRAVAHCHRHAGPEPHVGACHYGRGSARASRLPLPLTFYPPTAVPEDDRRAAHRRLQQSTQSQPRRAWKDPARGRVARRCSAALADPLPPTFYPPMALPRRRSRLHAVSLTQSQRHAVNLTCYLLLLVTSQPNTEVSVPGHICNFQGNPAPLSQHATRGNPS
jgi:hypothetical protein